MSIANITPPRVSTSTVKIRKPVIITLYSWSPLACVIPVSLVILMMHGAKHGANVFAGMAGSKRTAFFHFMKCHVPTTCVIIKCTGTSYKI